MYLPNVPPPLPKIANVGIFIVKNCFLVVAFLVIALITVGSAQTPNQPQPCTAPEYRQLDFWLGDWDVFEADGVTPAAHVRVTRTLDGCVLHEAYEDPTGLHGQSFSIYDSTRKVWHQTWVTNRGQLLMIEGRLEQGALVMRGRSRSDDGKMVLVRAVWKPDAQGVRETAERSYDGGKTWKLWFDLLFRLRKVDSSAGSDDAKTVAALDKQYQEAVKGNDAATMDRILADDFLLVTGTGRRQTKSDLLAEARSRKTTYEQQDEFEQSVRVYGDTAIVTAKLWIKGATDGKPFDYKLWFSDTYVRTPAGWRYVFGQASRPLEP